MTDSLTTPWIEEHAAASERGGQTRRRPAPRGQPCGAATTVPIEPEAFRAELAGGGSEASPDPYDEGFGAYQAGTGLADNPYPGDSCAHLQWANGWSQARDEAQRRAR